MKHLLQNLKTGIIEVADIPCPTCIPGSLLIQTRASVVSAGTERMAVEFGKASLLAKARLQPERVGQVLARIKTDGLLPTMEMVFAKLDEPMPLGYSNAGVVVAVGEGVDGFAVGDRVASNGSHSEIVCVPQNLCTAIPDDVDEDSAAFTVLGSISLQGIRLLKPTLGETFAVTGLGLLGLLAVQELAASGCRVLGIDPDPARSKLAQSFGAEIVDLAAGADPVARAMEFTRGRGVDGVLITAAAKDNTIVKQAAHMCRKRGRIVLVGVVGLDLDRADFYKKELTFQVSCSYGPGRYDPVYEDKGQDYPFPYVRWTQQRNFDAVLELLRSGRLDVKPLITRRFDLADAPAAYKVLTDERDVLGIVLDYPAEAAPISRSVAVRHSAKPTAPIGSLGVGIIGAGAMAKGAILPALKDCPVSIRAIADIRGAGALHAARKYNISKVTTDHRELLDDPDIHLIVIATRHDSHARLAAESLRAGKHTFVEKPLALNEEQLRLVRDAYEGADDLQLMVGFNRRFAPMVRKMCQLIAGRSGPLCMSMMVNAGDLPVDHWAVDPVEGGGRIIGEGCHWMDLMSAIAESPIESVGAQKVGRPAGTAKPEDTMSITVRLADGSMGTLHYFPNGSRHYAKERMEIFSDGRVLVLDNYRTLCGYGFKNFKRLKARRIDKGHRHEFAELTRRLCEGGDHVMTFAHAARVTLASFAALSAARSGRVVAVDLAALDASSDAEVHGARMSS